MLSVSIIEAPTKMGSVGRSTCSKGIVVVPLGGGTAKRAGDSAFFDYTDLCN
jgi:hypothetical protein